MTSRSTIDIQEHFTATNYSSYISVSTSNRIPCGPPVNVAAPALWVGLPLRDLSIRPVNH